MVNTDLVTDHNVKCVKSWGIWISIVGLGIIKILSLIGAIITTIHQVTIILFNYIFINNHHDHHNKI